MFDFMFFKFPFSLKWSPAKLTECLLCVRHNTNHLNTLLTQSLQSYELEIKRIYRIIKKSKQLALYMLTRMLSYRAEVWFPIGLNLLITAVWSWIHDSSLKTEIPDDDIRKKLHDVQPIKKFPLSF